MSKCKHLFLLFTLFLFAGLSVNTYAGPVAVPDVTGNTVAAATTAIEGVGLVVGASSNQNHPTIPSGSVISTNPAKDTLVTIGSNVDLVVSTGPAQVAVPDITGLTEADAISAITSASLVVGTRTTASSGTVPAGDIISQNPTAGNMVNVGTPVDMEVSTGAVPPPQVAVPDVVGDTEAAAATAITGAGLVVGTKTSQADPTVPAGNIISQTPTAGTMVNTGTSVNLVVSTGPAQVAVPDVVGNTEAAATTAITGAGLTVGTKTSQADPTIPSGSIISQTPIAGTQVNTGSAVDLVISTGVTPPPQVAVPDVVGNTEAAATTAITGAGLVVGTTTNQNDPNVPAGDVISQNPIADTMVNVGSAVDLVVSTGPAPPPVTVPGVVGLDEAAATSAIEAATLVASSTSQNDPNIPAGEVISQNPTAGSTVATGSTVNIVVSLGPPPPQVTVPNVVGMAEADAVAALQNAGFVATTSSASSATVPVGAVISQDPAGNSSAPDGSTVSIVISTGLQTVPDVPLAGSNTTVTITTQAGEAITDVGTAEASGGPSGINFPFGTIAYTTTSAVGGSVTMRFEFSSDLPDDLVVYKVDNNGVYTELPTAIWTQIDARTIDVTVTDGDPVTDQDGAVNGSIEDPIAIGGVQSTGGGGGGDDDGDLFDFGGGGCTISNTQSASMDPIWLLMLLVPGLGIMRRRVAATGNTSRGRN